MEHKWYKTMRPPGLKDKLKTWQFWRPVLAIAVGAIGGFLFFYFNHCKAPNCAFTGQTWSNVFWGAVMGFFVVNNPCSRGAC